MSLNRAKALREKRANLWERQKELLESANDGLMTEEARSEFDRIETDMAAQAEEIRRIEAHADTESELRASSGRIVQPGTVGSDVDAAEAVTPEARNLARNEAFKVWATRGDTALNSDQRTALRELRAQSTAVAAGGYTIPQDFSGELEVALKQYGGVRQAARIMPTDSGAAMPWPTVNDSANIGRLLAENTVVTKTDMVFGVVNFGAYKFSSDSVLVSEELLQDSAFDLNAFIGESLGVRLARITNQFATTGTGSAQPQGVATAAVGGHNLVGALDWTDLVELEHSVDPAYRASPSCRWMFNDSTLKDLKVLKDEDNRPIWLPGVATREADTILGYQYTVNQDVADLEDEAKGILFGDFSKFVIRDVRGFTLLRLVERYADFHQVGFLAFMRMDSRLVDAGTNPIKAMVAPAAGS